MSQGIMSHYLRPTVGRYFEQLTVSSSVQVLTPAKYMAADMSGGAQEAFITNYGNSLRYTYDGTTPSSTIGHVLPDQGVLVLRGQQQMKNFKCIRVSADSEISITYEYI